MLIPDNITDFESIGERLLYLKFRNDGSTKNYYVLHSVFTNFHLKNMTGELDFLVLVPGHGFFAIEVKHGNVWRSAGKWHFENKNGQVTIKDRSPFSQVDVTMHSIRNFILKKFENNKREQNRFSKILFGTGIAFTGLNEFIDFSPEGHSWQVFTRSSMNLPISYFIESISKGWHDENSGKNFYDVNLSRPTEDDCKKVFQILRGDFDIDYTVINRINDNEQLINEYTKEQFNLLDFVNYNKRCLIQGSAGTGKTLMALELANRYIEKGKKVGLFCFNSNLGNKLNELLLKLSLNRDSNFFAGTLHSYISSGSELNLPIDDADLDNYYSEILPLDFLLRNEKISEDEKFDFLIIDEAQDLITPNYLEVFSSFLKGGIAGGNWAFFGDFTNQAIYLNDPLTTLDLLNSKTNFTIFPTLKINCRNTQKIATQNTLLTGIEKAEFPNNYLEGDKIENLFPAKTDVCLYLEEVIEKLIKEGIPLDNISLLSPKKFINSSVSESSKIKYWLSKKLIFSTIQSYKGLENTFIILFDFEEISSVDSLRLLYIGISRAKQKLYLVLNNNLEIEYRNLILKNFNKF
jgi:hypothetical protein